MILQLYMIDSNAILDDISIEYVPETTYMVWGLDLSGTLQGAGGVGGLLAEITPGGVRHPFCDGNGNITDWVNEDGEVVAHYEYDPYGNEMPGNPPTSFGFSSKPFDSTLGLYYYGYRFYRPDLGRWINRDPRDDIAFIFCPGVRLFGGIPYNTCQNESCECACP